MKYIATILMCVLCTSVLAYNNEPVITPYIDIGIEPMPVDTNSTEMINALISETVKVIQDEGWTATDVADAIRSLRGLYLRDNSTAEGRRRWHGSVVTTSVDTNAMIRTTVYEDGETFVDPAKVVTAAASVAASNARLPQPVMTNGVPEKLAAARLRRQAEVAQGVSNVTVTVVAGGRD